MFPSSFFIINDSIGSCEASFHSEAVVHIYAKPICCNAKIKRCHRRTQVFVNVFDVHFIFHLFHLGFSLVHVSLRSFLLKQRVKQFPKYQMLSQGKLHRVARNSSFSRKLTACNVFQNIRFNGSRETRVSSLETRVSSLATRVSSLETRVSSREKRDEGW